MNSHLMLEGRALNLDEALELNPVSLFQYRLLLLCGFAYMSDALEVNLLFFISACAGADWDLANAQQASITGTVFVGVILGSLFWGSFADRFGRRLTYFCSCTLILLGGLLSGAAPSYPWLLTFLVIAGFGIGGANVPFDLLAEFLPSSHRGSFLVYIELFWTVGSMYVAGLAWGTLNTQGWRFLAYMAAAPIFLVMIVAAVYLPESPRWLLVKGRKTEAVEVIRAAARTNGIEMKEFDLLDEEEENEENARYVDLFLKPDARKLTIPLLALWFLFGFTYYGTVLFVSRLYSNHDSGEDSNAAEECSFDYPPIFYNAMTEIVSAALSAIVIDRWGRVRSQTVFYLFGGFAVLSMGMGLTAAPLLIVSCLARLAAMSSTIATWVTTPELFSTEMRTVGHASCAAISKIGAILAPFLVISQAEPIIVAIIIGSMSASAAFIANTLPETSGRKMGSVSQLALATSPLHVDTNLPSILSSDVTKGFIKCATEDTDFEANATKEGRGVDAAAN